MRILTVIVSLLVAAQSEAEFIKCFFTEPFVESFYDLDTSILIYRNLDSSSDTYKNVAFHIQGPGDFLLKTEEGQVLQELKLNFNGSDGMSDDIYPYDVRDYTKLTRPGFGGCESSRLKRKSMSAHGEN